jgi:hypothetical protein
MIHKLAGVYREYGLVLGVLYGLDQVLQRLSSRLRIFVYQLMVQPITDRPLLPARFARRYEIREIKKGDAELALMSARSDIRESRFDQHAICLGAFSDGRLVGYIWFCYGKYEEDEVRCTYVLPSAEEAVFDFDLYIFPEHRMGLGFVAIWQGANAYLKARGIRFTFSRLTRFNLASRRAHDHLGWKSIGRACFLAIGPVELMLATLRPYLHLSWSRANRVRLQLFPAKDKE